VRLRPLVCGCGDVAAGGFLSHRPGDPGGIAFGRDAKAVACATAANSPFAVGDTAHHGPSSPGARLSFGHADMQQHCNIPDLFSGGDFLLFPDGSFCRQMLGPYAALCWDKSAIIFCPKLPDRDKNGKKKRE